MRSENAIPVSQHLLRLALWATGLMASASTIFPIRLESSSSRYRLSAGHPLGPLVLRKLHLSSPQVRIRCWSIHLCKPKVAGQCGSRRYQSLLLSHWIPESALLPSNLEVGTGVQKAPPKTTLCLHRSCASPWRTGSRTTGCCSHWRTQSDSKGNAAWTTFFHVHTKRYIVILT